MPQGSRSTNNSGTGKKKAKRGQPHPWTKPGHNGSYPADHKQRGGRAAVR